VQHVYAALDHVADKYPFGHFNLSCSNFGISNFPLPNMRKNSKTLPEARVGTKARLVLLLQGWKLEKAGLSWTHSPLPAASIH
jgi:hypothetical protein